MLLLSLLALVLASGNLAEKAEEAKQAMAARDFSKAIEIYRELNRAVPGDANVQLNLGLALYSGGRYEESREILDQVLKTDPRNRPALLFSGIDWSKLDKPQRAVPLISKFLAEAGDSALGWMELGNAHLAMQAAQAAVDDFSKASALEPNNPRAWNGLGMSYWVLARQQFEWIETNALFSPEWYALVARSELQQQQYQRAFGHFRKAASKGRALPGVHAGLAEVYRNTGHADWASIEENRESAAKLQDAPEVTAHYLQALSNQQRAAEALAHLQTLPPSADLHNLLGFAYRAQHRDTESAAEFQRALEFDPDNAALRKEWATSLWLAGDCAHAEPILTKLLQRTPNSPALNHMMGDCLVSNGRFGEALPLLRTALATDPSFLPADASLGRALLHLGHYAEAISHLKRATPLRDKQILYQLAQAYRKAGDEANATRYLEEYRRYQTGEEPLQEARLGSDIAGP